LKLSECDVNLILEQLASNLETPIANSIGLELSHLQQLSHEEDSVYLSLDRMVPRNVEKHQNCHQLTVIGELLMRKLRSSN